MSDHSGMKYLKFKYQAPIGVEIIFPHFIILLWCFLIVMQSTLLQFAANKSTNPSWKC